MAAKNPRIGTIDLPSLFEAAAAGLTLAVKQGRLLHKTKNIRDAGAPLEAEFRAFLGKRLPSPFTISSGYLFDPASTCTPQIDAIVVDGTESHELMRSTDGASYVPYPSALAVFEIKNSGAGLKSHIAQLEAVIAGVDKMRLDAAPMRLSGAPSSKRPLSVLIIGDSSDVKPSQLKKAFASALTAPVYTLLLDRGLIVARRAALDDLIVFAGRDGVSKPFAMDFSGHEASGEWGIWHPEKGGPGKGLALMWLYFAVVAHLNRVARDDKGRILDFTNQIARDYPMVLKSTLAKLTKW